jgi:hypothetical protein
MKATSIPENSTGTLLLTCARDSRHWPIGRGAAAAVEPAEQTNTTATQANNSQQLEFPSKMLQLDQNNMGSPEI